MLAVTLMGVWLSSGCAGNQPELDPRDPWEPTNRDMYNYNDGLDKAILAPVAEQYVKLPQGMRTSVRNFFVNLGYPTTVINQFLQGKVERGLDDTMRFVFNTTFGVLGLFDFAGGVGLPRNEEDFGQTFAVWGAPAGPYMVIPLLGPSSVRDAAGIPLNFLSKPLFWIETPSEFFALAGLDLVDTRARLIPAIRLRDETAFDPYIFTREAYLQQRLNLIYDGNPPLEKLDDLELLDEIDEKAPPPEGTPP